MKFDLDALLESPAAMVELPLFLLCFLIVRGVPTWFLNRSDLPKRSVTALSLLASAGLPLIVVITEIGVSSDRMDPGDAASLVGAGMVSVLVFPLLAAKLRTKDRVDGLTAHLAGRRDARVVVGERPVEVSLVLLSGVPECAHLRSFEGDGGALRIVLVVVADVLAAGDDVVERPSQRFELHGGRLPLLLQLLSTVDLGHRSGLPPQQGMRSSDRRAPA